MLKIYSSLFIFFIVFSFAKAQENYLAQDALSISPFIFEETMEKGEVLEKEIEVRNLSERPLPLGLSINDFVPADADGHVRFLTEQEKADDKFSLAHWISIVEQPDFILEPKSTTKVKFRITAPIQADEGTHYGGLLFGVESQNKIVSGSQVKQKLGAIIIVTLGKVEEKGEISAFLVNSDWKSKTLLEFSTIFHNQGRSRLIPKGEIEIRNWYGKLIASDYINKDGTLVLPEVERNYVTRLEKPFLFGYYTAESYVQFGNPKQEKRAKIGFWVLPKTPIFVGVLTIILLILAIKQYNRRLLKKAGIKIKNND